MSSNAIATARPEIAPLLQRWYVLIVMCVVYAINIAARYVVTTVFEPIRLELKLTDTGAAFLTGPPLALFYVSLRNSDRLACRPLQSSQHRGGLAHRVVGLHRVLRDGGELLAVPARPHRRGRR